MADAAPQTNEYLPAFQASSITILVSATISEDRCKLFIDCQLRIIEGAPPPKCNRDELVALLSEHIGVDKLDLAVIDNVVKELNDGRAVSKRRIAKGTPPEHGVDGRISFLVKKYQPPTENREREAADLRHIHNFDNVTVDMPVARVYPPTDGKDGVDVYGKPVKATKGKRPRFFVDKSVKVVSSPSGDSYDQILSAAEGYLLEDNGKIKIVNELAIDGDVDFVTGSIDFIGSVKIKGNVMKSFYVMAKGNIEIGANVEEAYLESKEGAIIVAGTISGHYIPQEVILRDTERRKRNIVNTIRPNIRAAKTLTVFRVHNANIDCGEGIEVGKEIINSEVRTNKALHIPRGQLLAGNFNVGKGLEARLIGTNGGSHTVIYIKSDLETSAEYAELLQNIANHKHAAELVRLQLGPYADDLEAIKKLSDYQKQKIVGFLQKLKGITDNLVELEGQQKEILSNVSERKQIRINFHERLFKGTEIHAKNAKLLIEHDYGGPKSIVYRADDSIFHFCQLKPLDEEEVFETPKAEGKASNDSEQPKTDDKSGIKQEINDNKVEKGEKDNG
ncbi:MAG: DUF342 domain-containing protein [Deltaproteobacteria bacterium]|nr:DUF342 domain-containing protein [Deltaproteobacteria bacterium]